jgi:PAS domain S-box-containing protein
MSCPTRSELKELDGQLQMLAESANEAIFTIDENSTILTVNSAVQQTFGYSPAELIGHKITMLMPAEMAERHEHGVRRYVATGRRKVSWEGISLRGVHKSGRPLPLRISFAEFWRGGKRVFTGFAKLES